MSVRRPLSVDDFGAQSRCDVCGRSATWRQRVSTACCVYGEVLCDQCEAKRWQRFETGDLGADLAGFTSWLFEKAGSLSALARASLKRALKEIACSQA